MVLAIIFLFIFLGLTGFGIYRSVSLTKTPMLNLDYKKFFIYQGALIIGSAIALLVASFGFYQWLNAVPDVLHVIQLVVGALLWIISLLVSINCFIIHYYGRNLPMELDKWLFKTIIIGGVLSVIFFFVWTNGLAPYLTYPLINGINFKEGFVTPSSGVSPNLAFYALCILGGAIIVYFVCDHFMYKKYGRHGTLESTFIVAFPAGILGARIWYVVGNWAKEFDYGRAMAYLGEMKVWAPLAIWNGGLTVLGGAIMGIVVGVAWYLWRNKTMSIWYAVDMIVPTILIAQAVGRWGNFFNCEVHGLEVSGDYFKWLPEIIYRNAQYSSTSGWAAEGHIFVPLFFIECFANLFGYFLIAHVFGKLLGKHNEPGDLCFGYVIWYGLTRVLMEPLRSADFQMGQDGYWSWVWSMIFVFVGTLLIVTNHIIRRILKNKKKEPVNSNQQLGIISTIIITLVGGALLISGLLLMANNQFNPVVTYNSFNVGLIILVLGCSILLTLGISLPILFNSFKAKEAFNE